jgi:hypothetical protein
VALRQLVAERFDAGTDLAHQDRVLDAGEVLVGPGQAVEVPLTMLGGIGVAARA